MAITDPRLQSTNKKERFQVFTDFVKRGDYALKSNGQPTAGGLSRARKDYLDAYGQAPAAAKKNPQIAETTATSTMVSDAGMAMPAPDTAMTAEKKRRKDMLTATSGAASTLLSDKLG